MSNRLILQVLFSFVLLTSPAWSQSQKISEEIVSGPGRGEAKISVPKEYGKLISVVESGGVHYLYFQDEESNIRIFLLGIKGSASRARIELEALPHTVYKIPRSSEEETPPDK